RSLSTSWEAPTGTPRSRRASSPVTRTSGATPPATSVSRTTATGWPTATSRSGYCRERPRQALDDDVPPVLHLGRLVHDDRAVHDPARDGDADAMALHGEPDCGHRRAVFPWARRRPLLRDRESPRRPPLAGRRGHVPGAPGDRRTDGVHSSPVALQPLLHADARSREQPRVPPHPVAGAAVSVHPRVLHGGLDRGGTLHQLGAQSAVGRGRGANAAPCLHHRDGEYHPGTL